MKTNIAFGIIGIIVLLFIISQLYFMSAQKDIEQYPYAVEKTYPNFEIRRYKSALFTSVKLPTNNYKKASSQGFSILAGYIFGDNKKNEKIAMTSPVAMTLKDTTTMMFLVPEKYNRENVPTPNQSNIEFVQMPERRMAAITFNGWANDKKIASYKKELVTALEKQHIAYSNNFLFLGYNAPFELFNRKNEVIVVLE